jgi:hypothetical protein
MKPLVYLACFTLSLMMILPGCGQMTNTAVQHPPQHEERPHESDAPNDTLNHNAAATTNPEDLSALPKALDPAAESLDHQLGEPVLLAESEDGSVAIRGIREPEWGDYADIIVEINGVSQTFNSTENLSTKHGKFAWYNVNNPTYWPELTVTDLDGDGTDEIIIILTYGYGTGTHASTIHVLQPDFTEIPFPDVVDDANEAYSHTVDVTDDQRIFHIQVGGNSYTLPFPADYSHMWWDGWHAGNIVRYRVEGDQIAASVSVHITDMTTSGSVEIYYKLQDGHFHRNETRFEPTDYHF